MSLPADRARLESAKNSQSDAEDAFHREQPPDQPQHHTHDLPHPVDHVQKVILQSVNRKNKLIIEFGINYSGETGKKHNRPQQSSMENF